ncbi:unnamed protein product [Tilletia controversa]|uniref:DNA-(apurinic or apyrimidinic site) endonuclease n=2 Tax=Tilletia TaxID=13289 RepID=A0A177V871_9BASI|nr:hypothetical protein CF336_g1246 [Tilletia laevis]KAE8201935.1 hypothetical protein CF328_g2503 [Tilletia controversa]KAE8264568.1 hypothetical protein A4X03_0g848 [Tilletia caries]KAE8207305.1 hypothetical protein CF335_g1239 [Tilletia laevis]CAD6887125.1 unnamed protein product [Tilletia caries]
MRIVSFNVNGLRTLRGYQPWYSKKDFEACLDFLQGDIVCFQETKMTRKQLDRQLAIVPSFHSFFNFHPTKGYSGTAIYVRKTVSIPIRAECGITGEWLPPGGKGGGGSGNDGSVIGGVPRDAKDALELQLWRNLDLEGRSVVIDCGMFVLFNLYCPNLTGPERAEYKQAFNRVLGERANQLLDQGREVIIVGDLNICYQPIDHADPEQSLKDHGISEFGETPGRQWLKTILDPAAGGRFIDAARHLHPNRTKMYTCWNQKIDARPANYGTRIDFTLVSRGLLPWLKSADIQADVYGSDHCPVYVELHDEREIDGRKVKLRDLMHGWDREKEPEGPSVRPPPLAACNEEEFSDKRRSIASFFTAPASSKSGGKANKVAPSSASEAVKTLSPSSSSLAVELPPTNPIATDELSVADAFSALHSAEHAPKESDSKIDAQVSDDRTRTVESATPQPPIFSQSQAEDTASHAREVTSSQSAPTSSILSGQSALKGANSSQNQTKGQKSSTSVKGKGPAKKGDDRQPTLTGFFSRSTRAPATTAPPDGNQSQGSSTPIKPPSPSPRLDLTDAIEDRIVASSSQPSEMDSVPATAADDANANDPDCAAKRVGTALAWGSIFTAPPPPKCSLHSETAKAWTVNKTGKNHGRKFWLCSRPVGPGYEKSGRSKYDVNPEFRCDYFVWDSDLRTGRAAAASSTTSPSSSTTSGIGTKRSALSKSPTATLSDVSMARQRREAADVTSPHKRVKTGRSSSPRKGGDAS